MQGEDGVTRNTYDTLVYQLNNMVACVHTVLYSILKYEPHRNYTSDIISNFHTVMTVISQGTLLISIAGQNAPLLGEGVCLATVPYISYILKYATNQTTKPPEHSQQSQQNSEPLYN